MYEPDNTYRGLVMSIIKLMMFEYKRIWKLYLALVIAVTCIQLFFIWYGSYTHAEMYKELARESGRTYYQIAQQDQLSFVHVFNSFPIHASIMISIAALLLYSCFIWYRDWVGKYPMAQRLLTLPIHRSALYFSKLGTIFTFVLGMIALQYLIILAGIGLVHLTVPSEFLQSNPLVLSSIARFSQVFSVILPLTFKSFLLMYGTGFTFLTVAFTVIVIERSFRMKGWFIGAAYMAIAVAFNGLGTYISLKLHLFESEVFIVFGFTLVITSILSSLLCIYLLQRKVTV